MTAQAIQQAGIPTETINPGGLGTEIVAQATVSASPQGEVIVTARADSAVTRLLTRRHNPVRVSEEMAPAEIRRATHCDATSTTVAAKGTEAGSAGTDGYKARK